MGEKKQFFRSSTLFPGDSMNSPFPDISRGRLLSIDALRGFDMFWIIGGGPLVIRLFEQLNLPFADAVKNQLAHSLWDGCTFEDLIFPLFLFIMGICIPMSFSKRLERGEPKGGLYIRIFKRFALIFTLGLIYNGLLNLNFAEMRYAGVLQRIALCYFFTALIFINTSLRGQITWAAGLLLGYWAAMTLIPVPGFGAGVLTPAGNLSFWFDRLALPGKFYGVGFTQGDTLGILSTIPAVGSALLGVLAYHWIQSNRAPAAKTLGLIIAGCVGIIAALLWNIVFPINKLIWTSSYALLAGGFCAIIFAAFYWVIDVKGWRNWSFPLVVIGMNAIFIYVLHRMIRVETVIDPLIRGMAALTGDFKPVFILSCTLAAKWLLLWFMYKRKIFIKA
jgi:predicted acyltransferase